MYPPLRYIEQVEDYLKLPTSKNMEFIVNSKALKFAEDYLKVNRSKLYHDYGIARSSEPLTEDFTTYYDDLCKKFSSTLRIQGGMDNQNDFLELLIFYDVRNIWRRNKLSYIVDNSLFSSLLNMNTPKLAPIDCLVKLPADCFYIDYNGLGDEFMQGLQGTFISTSKSSDELNIVLVHLVDSSESNRVLFITTVLRLSLDGHEESEKFIPKTSILPTSLEVECEDGVVRVINEKKICTFLFNFLVYLHASNRDITVTERTRKNHDKEVKAIKNKFREVKEFGVGFTYGRFIREGATRIKYVDDSESKQPDKPAGSLKSSHYRSAHWHHYWTGSGDDKKLIIKWVEGVFINGGKDEAEKVQIHKVK